MSAIRLCQNSFDKNFKSDCNKDNPAENGCFPGKPCAEFTADKKSRNADGKGYDSYYNGLRDCGCGRVVGDGETYGKGVDGRGNALKHQPPETDGAFFCFICVAQTVNQHFTAYKQKQYERNPGYEFPEGIEDAGNGMDTDPSDERHDNLKTAEGARYCAYAAFFHTRFIESVCH